MAEKLAAKAKAVPDQPVLGTFLVMFAIINVSYFAYGGVVRRDQGERSGDVGRVSVAVSRGESV